MKSKAQDHFRVTHLLWVVALSVALTVMPNSIDTALSKAILAIIGVLAIMRGAGSIGNGDALLRAISAYCFGSPKYKPRS